MRRVSLQGWPLLLLAAIATAATAPSRPRNRSMEKGSSGICVGGDSHNRYPSQQSSRAACSRTEQSSLSRAFYPHQRVVPSCALTYCRALQVK
ncbi:hypothetical protein GGR56DRAFT_617208 [Xylariaceae sp. FL0804]|nr:hypothetical protein GGR56DRAFT_617208 [Xylariaceae sp. FL0804]